VAARGVKMQKCVNCGHENRPGVMYCENCGVSLSGKAPLDTKSVDASSEEEKTQLGIDESVLTNVRIQGAGTFNQQDFLRLDIEGSPEPIVLKPEAETIFGRRDPATGAMPDVDLTPFAGYRMGVSRRHAAIRFGDGQSLNLWDLGSSNGTYLNGERLSAHRPYRLHDGDELRLGQMLIRVRFQASPETPKPAQEKAEEPTEVKVEKPADAEAEKPVKVEAKAEVPAETKAPVEKPAEAPAAQPAEAGTETAKPDEPSEGVITLSPITDVFKKPEVTVEDQQEWVETPTTKQVGDEPPAKQPDAPANKPLLKQEKADSPPPPAPPDTSP
jgi:pSer/pThr/pTyr-binding forkhead associated (FHA) protein